MSDRTGYHEGERAVQARAGLRHEADRYVGMLAQHDLDGVEGFLAEQTFAVLTGRDHDGILWTSPLVAPAGFLDARDNILVVRAVPPSGDPLAGLAAGQPVGFLAIDFSTRRRFRINGRLLQASTDRLQVIVDQAYGNCPKYIQKRTLEADHKTGSCETAGYLATEALGALDAAGFTATQARVIDEAVTFFLGTTHPTGGVDASHRGGPAGFVRRQDGGLWWPDYPGNNMFNSLGNLAVDPTASLLFVDFRTGETLHLSGAAQTDWLPPGTSGDDGRTGRRVQFAPAHIGHGPALPIHETDSSPYPKNPPVTN